jgi:hypothetical protein
MGTFSPGILQLDLARGGVAKRRHFVLLSFDMVNRLENARQIAIDAQFQ